MTASTLHLGTLALIMLFAGACDPAAPPTAPGGEKDAGGTFAPVVRMPSGRATSTATSTASAPPPAGATERQAAMQAADFARLVDKLSEPDAEFFSDNFISNETSYLQVATALAAREKGGVYIGVGPEQNFTYIALMQPEFAYLVDIRRDNLVLHLLYKAAFERATSRAHFLALLTGRAYAGDDDLPSDASLEQVLAHAEREKPSAKTFERIHGQLRSHIRNESGVELDDKDTRSLRRSHHAFFLGGLDLRFSLKEQSFRRYPSLRELLVQTDTAGRQTGFLGSERSFRFVQRMQRDNRIIPLVGDFAGDRAMPALAAHMVDNGQTLRGFYVSNVEQYLMVDGKWWRWQRNVVAFPTDEHSVFIRCYLDQGRPHPAQMAGHRTATTIHLVADFNARKKPYSSMLALASDNSLAQP